MACQSEICTEDWSQFWVHMRDCTISGASELRNRSSIRPPILNVDSEATVETGTANTSHVSRDSILYLLVLHFYQASILKFLSFSPSLFSIKYFATSSTHSTDCFPCLKALY